MADVDAPVPLGERLRDLAARVGPGIVDLGVVAALLVLALFDLLVVYDQQGRTSWGLAVAGAAVVGVLVRRIRLLPSFLLLVAVVAADGLVIRTGLVSARELYDLPRLSGIAALTVVVTPVVRRSSARVATAAALAGLVAVAGTAYASAASGGGLQREGLLVLGSVLLGLVVLYGLGVGIGVYLRDLDRQRRDAAELARAAVRVDLARDLHDLIAHHVTAIVVQAQAGQLVAGDPERTAAVLRTIEGEAQRSLGAMRSLVGSLRVTAATRPTAGLDEIRALATGDPGGEATTAGSVAAGPPVEVTISDEARRLVSEDLAVTVHRIAREAVTNARRHARSATAIGVRVEVEGPAVTLTVADDGRGLLHDGGEGYGLAGMRERAELVGGTVRAGPAEPPEIGWRVLASFPIRSGAGR